MVNLKFGVPCSRIKDKITDVDVFCPNEEIAFGLACGCILAGKHPIVYLQNSGLLRCGDIITSLYHAYQIPLPKLLLSIRHSPKHHEFSGKITKRFLTLMRYSGDIEIVEQEEK